MTQQERDAFWAEWEAVKEQVAAEVDAALVAAFDDLPLQYHIALDDWTLWLLARREQGQAGQAA